MLDELLTDEKCFNWDEFYSDRDKKIPFFINFPDENLASYFEKGYVSTGKALELGCGPGRNAIYLAEKGFVVDAVDLSIEALEWAGERAKERNASVNFLSRNIFELEFSEGTYDLVYDSGCFHHIAPHRRMSYIKLVMKALKPGGYFAITCFVEGGKLGGSAISDLEVYKLRSLQGGLGFTEEKLKKIFHEFEVVEIRRMREVSENEELFGVEGLWAGLFQKGSL
ncbi:class I SAM-dependent methyltransferase [Anaerobacillus alkaliphilus]|uniref:Class I SAM-dependent methyltransferase n=1 Tax=Anaerobacillus alkaliphilus TaxID=1548597 RepID=A0A4Q0VZZ5_9BACI|nr:class I SAM-dependent methyltransferase [Anaerobacillus alkaliphilus]RXJ04646.1 class I SAM-dependent methyltransferase [Anaerobacillus alkaliphilus]